MSAPLPNCYRPQQTSWRDYLVRSATAAIRCRTQQSNALRVCGAPGTRSHVSRSTDKSPKATKVTNQNLAAERESSANALRGVEPHRDRTCAAQHAAEWRHT